MCAIEVFVWKRVCCRTGSGALTCSYISVILGHTDKSSLIHLLNLQRLYVKNDILGFYSTNKVGTLWSLLYFYCNWQLSAKKTTTREWEGMGVILPGVERDFPPVFSWDWDGKRLKFVMHFGNRRWAPGLMRHLAWETRSQRLTFSHYLGSTHILNAFGRIQMSHFNLD